MVELPRYELERLRANARDPEAAYWREVYTAGNLLVAHGISEVWDDIRVVTTTEHWTIKCPKGSLPIAERVVAYVTIERVTIFRTHQRRAHLKVDGWALKLDPASFAEQLPPFRENMGMLARLTWLNGMP